jgi:hypothetical protein
MVVGIVTTTVGVSLLAAGSISTESTSGPRSVPRASRSVPG